MIILLFFAFLSGLVTILAPCIWPLLPIILSSTVTGEKRKPLGITLGIMLSFGLFTLTVSYLVSLFHFDPNALRLFAVVVIGFLGLTLVIPALSRILEGYVSKFTGFLGGRFIGQQTHGFHGGFVTGVALGLVWSPCAGPILATIATLAATRTVNAEIILVTIAYIVGLGIPLFLFATAGSIFFTRTKFISAYTGTIQKIFGVIMIITALLIYTNYDKVIQAKLLDIFPAYSTFLYNLESSEEVKKQLNQIKNIEEDMKKDMPNTSTLKNYGPAPEFVGITKWLNPETPLAMEDLRGKVVLIDIWTYTCINCIRTLPHVTGWYDTYRDKGLVVIGVHTPEFEFEKKTENVLAAIKQYNIHYPVAQDNDFATWKAYNNHYWPAKYLVDTKGNIRYFHFGEGKYEETERAIQTLLAEAGQAVTGTTPIPDETPKGSLTPETYLGSARRDRFRATTENLPLHYFVYEGRWDVYEEYAESIQDASLTLRFFANKVFLVVTSAGTNDSAKIFLDGNFVKEVTFPEPRLYELIDLGGNKGDHILRIEFQNEGTAVFAFTFG